MEIECPHCGKKSSQVKTSKDGEKFYCYHCEGLIRDFTKTYG